MSLDRDAICNYFLSLQDLIVGTLEKEDEKNFHVDSWERPGGGGGRTKRSGPAFLDTGIHIPFIVITDINEFFISFRSTR